MLFLLRIFLSGEFLLREGNTTREMEFVLTDPVASCNSTVVLLNYTYSIKKSYLLGK